MAAMAPAANTARLSAWRRRAPVPRRAALGARAAAADGADAAASAKPKRFTVALRRPLGIVLEQKGKDGPIYVAEVADEGRAKGLLLEGDVLISCSAMTRTKTQDYGGVTVQTGEERVVFSTAGEKFDTVLAAISSNPSNEDIKLEFERPVAQN